jgi:hypothetical protein
MKMDMKNTQIEEIDIESKTIKDIELEKETCHNHKHSPVKHLLHIIICCGMPVLIILSLPFISRYSPAAAAVLGVIAPFICPVMMGGMMFMMFGGHKKNPSHNYRMEEKESRRLY